MSKLPDAITTILESSINRYLALDPAAGASLDLLDNKSVSLKLKEFSSAIFFKVEDQKIKVFSSFEDETDVHMLSSIPVLINMTVASRGDESILGSEIEMSGNMEVGRQFRDIFKNLDIDWEEILSRYTGDIVAHKLGNGFRQFNHWLGATKQSIQRDISEYLQQESQQLPEADEVNGFIAQVDSIRQSVERAEARIKLLQNALENNK